MSEDPFARFESSRGGWLIPIGLFIAGAIGTTVAINAVHNNPVQRAPVQQQRANLIEVEQDAMEKEPDA